MQPLIPSIPDDAFYEEAITAADLEGPEGPEFDPQYLIVQSAFGLHITPGSDGDEGLRSENDIAELVRKALYHRKTLTLHIEF